MAVDTEYTPFPHRATLTWAGIACIACALMFYVPFMLLQMNFDYPAVLREEPGYILTQFRRGGGALVLTWYVFAMLGFPVLALVFLLHRVFSRTDTPWMTAAVAMGSMAALLQMMGLMRWVFVIPGIAAAYSNPEATDAMRQAAIMSFHAFHQYGGVALGEHLGQWFMACWIALVSLAMRDSDLVPRWIAPAGVAIATAMAIGTLEQFTTITSMPLEWLGVVTVLSFTLWSAWLLAVGVNLLWSGRRV